MAIKICPNCNRWYTVEADTTDFVHECNSGDDAIDQEDVLKTGDWEDYTGSGDVTNVLLQGTVNELQGTEAGILGEDEEPQTDRGKSKELYRSRQHLEYINLKEVDK